MATNSPQPLCQVCQKSTPNITLAISTCCGAEVHILCAPKSHTCLLCGKKHLRIGSAQDLKRIRKWASKGQTWAMTLLAVRYAEGKALIICILTIYRFNFSFILTLVFNFPHDSPLRSVQEKTASRKTTTVQSNI